MIIGLGLLVGAAALGGGFVSARNFVRRRLRYVDAVQRPAAPVVAGLAATAIALPPALLPGVTGAAPGAVGGGGGSGGGGGRGAPPPQTNPHPPLTPPGTPRRP